MRPTPPKIDSVYDFAARDISGRERSLSEFRGKPMLIVNVASKCGLTPQYEGLETLYQEYRERGLVILGFPSNDFAGQEPGSEAEIQSFCSVKFGVDFPMFAKVTVKGPNKHPLYRYLTEEAPHASEIKWNFHKFLINREGRVVENVDPRTEPRDLKPKIESLLG